MNVLVLGSAGQIGRAFCNYLSEQTEHNYIPFDISYGQSFDLRNRSSQLEAAVINCDVVLFLAYDVGGSTYLEKYQSSYEFIDNNTRMMQVVFSLVREYDKRVVFASSQMSMMPWSSYGMLKRVGELYAHSVGGIVVHFWNVYGIEHDESKFHVITDFARSALRGEINMRTTGEERRQFLHARDCSRALAALMEDYEPWVGKTVSITSFEWTSIAELANLVASTVGPHVKVNAGSKKDAVQGVMNTPDERILEIWTPEISLAEGVGEIVQFYRQQKVEA